MALPNPESLSGDPQVFLYSKREETPRNFQDDKLAIAVFCNTHC